jgi:hypothetical protein
MMKQRPRGDSTEIASMMASSQQHDAAYNNILK